MALPEPIGLLSGPTSGHLEGATRCRRSRSRRPARPAPCRSRGCCPLAKCPRRPTRRPLTRGEPQRQLAIRTANGHRPDGQRSATQRLWPTQPSLTRPTRPSRNRVGRAMQVRVHRSPVVAARGPFGLAVRRASLRLELVSQRHRPTLPSSNLDTTPKSGVRECHFPTCCVYSSDDDSGPTCETESGRASPSSCFPRPLTSLAEHGSHPAPDRVTDSATSGRACPRCGRTRATFPEARPHVVEPAISQSECHPQDRPDRLGEVTSKSHAVRVSGGGPRHV